MILNLCGQFRGSGPNMSVSEKVVTNMNMMFSLILIGFGNV